MAKIFVRSKILLLYLVTFAVHHTAIAQKTAKIIPVAEKGVIDLQNWDFEKDGVVKLDGEWEFYWNTFVEENNAPPSTDNHPDYIAIPNTWNDHLSIKKPRKSKGYASYKLHVKLKSNEELAIKFLNAATSCEVYVDGILLFSSGRPGKTKAKTIPSYHPGVFSFYPKSSEFEIVVQVANFHHRKGGLWEPLILGKKNKLTATPTSGYFLKFYLWALFL